MAGNERKMKMTTTIAAEFEDCTHNDLLNKPAEIRAGHERVMEEIVKAVLPHHPHAMHPADPGDITIDDLWTTLGGIDGHTLIAFSRALSLSESTKGDRDRKPQRFGK
jgi:hypothetical protein